MELFISSSNTTQWTYETWIIFTIIRLPINYYCSLLLTEFSCWILWVLRLTSNLFSLMMWTLLDLITYLCLKWLEYIIIVYFSISRAPPLILWNTGKEWSSESVLNTLEAIYKSLDQIDSIISWLSAFSRGSPADLEEMLIEYLMNDSNPRHSL